MSEPGVMGLRAAQNCELLSEIAAKANEDRSAARKSTQATITRGERNEIDDVEEEVFEIIGVAKSNTGLPAQSCAQSTLRLRRVHLIS